MMNPYLMIKRGFGYGTSIPCLTRSVFFLLMTSQSIATDIANALRDVIIGTRTRGKDIKHVTYRFYLRPYSRPVIQIQLLLMLYQMIILCMGPANERRCYRLTSSLIDLGHTQNDLTITVY